LGGREGIGATRSSTSAPARVRQTVRYSGRRDHPQALRPHEPRNPVLAKRTGRQSPAQNSPMRFRAWPAGALRPRGSKRSGAEIAREIAVPIRAAAVDGALVYLRAPRVAAACSAAATMWSWLAMR